MKNSISISKGRIRTSFEFQYREEDGFVDVIIPAFGLTYSAMDVETAKRRARSMVKAFYAYHLEEKGFKNLILTIHKLGWHSDKHNLVMKQLLKEGRSNAMFVQDAPTENESYSSEHLELQEAI